MAEVEDEPHDFVDETPLEQMSNLQRNQENNRRAIRNYIRAQRRLVPTQGGAEVEADEPMLAMKETADASPRGSPSAVLGAFKAILKRKGDALSPSKGPVAKKSRPEEDCDPDAPEEVIFVEILTTTMKFEKRYIPLTAFHPRALTHIAYNQHTLAKVTWDTPQDKPGKGSRVIDWNDAALLAVIGREDTMSKEQWQQAYVKYVEAMEIIWWRWKSHFATLDGYANKAAPEDFPAVLATDLEMRLRYTTRPFKFTTRYYKARFDDNLAKLRDDRVNKRNLEADQKIAAMERLLQQAPQQPRNPPALQQQHQQQQQGAHIQQQGGQQQQQRPAAGRALQGPLRPRSAAVPFGPAPAVGRRPPHASAAPASGTTRETVSTTTSRTAFAPGPSSEAEHSSRVPAHLKTPRSVAPGTPARAPAPTEPPASTCARIAAPPPTTPSATPLAANNDDEAQNFLDEHFSHLLDPHSAVYNKIVTPYNADEFERFIRKHNLEKHYDLPDKLRRGFPMGDFPELTVSVEFKNDRSVAENAEFVEEALQEEVAAGRMDGPYQTRGEVETELGGPVQISPLLVSVQTQAPGDPNKRRLCFHLSKGSSDHPSANSYADNGRFKFKSTTATQFGDKVSTSFFPFPSLFRIAPARAVHAGARAPFVLAAEPISAACAGAGSRPQSRVARATFAPAASHADTPVAQVAIAPTGTQFMTLDISKFHRTIPILPAHKRWFVIRAPSGYYINHCAPFGGSESSGNVGEVATAIDDIWKAEIVDDADHYEDDFNSLTFPIETSPEPAGGPNPHAQRFASLSGTTYAYKYTRVQALDRIQALRVPWHPEKWTDFAFEGEYIGFHWDLPQKRASLPEKKRLKFLRRVDDFIELCKRGRCTRHDVERIHGSLCHLCFVYPDGRSYLADITAFHARFEEREPLQTKHAPPSLYTALKWWKAELRKENVYRALVPLGEPTDPRIFVDASTDWGIGVEWMGLWAAWKGEGEWRSKQRHIGWLETIAVELVVRLLDAADVRNAHLRVHSDNQGVIGAFDKGRSRNHYINIALRRTFTILTARNIRISLKYVPSADNPRRFALERDPRALYYTYHAPRRAPRGAHLFCTHLTATQTHLVKEIRAGHVSQTPRPDLPCSDFGALQRDRQRARSSPLGRRQPATPTHSKHTATAPTATHNNDGADPAGSFHLHQDLATHPTTAPRAHLHILPSLGRPDLAPSSTSRENQAPQAQRRATRSRITSFNPRSSLEIAFVSGHPHSRRSSAPPSTNNSRQTWLTKSSTLYSTHTRPVHTRHTLAGSSVSTNFATTSASLSRTGCRPRAELLTAFAAEHISEVGGGTVKSWLAGVRASHDVVGAPWNGETRMLELVRRTAYKEGTHHTKPPRPPATLEHMRALVDNLDPKSGEDVAVRACALAAFWGCRRLGELTIPKGDGFETKYHVARNATVERADNAFKFHIPWTKSTGVKGGDVVLTDRDDDLCPSKALSLHFSVNDNPPRGDIPFFAFRSSEDGKWYPLTKSYFLSRCAAIWKACGLDDLAGHSLRIGGSSELLLAGVAPQMVAALGGWSSLAFLLYWRKLGHVIPRAIREAYHKTTYLELAKAMESFRVAEGITTLEINELVIRNEIS
ncbi:hypothetical protein HMN09_01252900 [Mycena chlorophos]|uniref:DNA breaking-rejoining enzyme n=1 Tax=Mycena chlorophos TaxID=658473 RepID=A0A8H6VVH0_MYCCL|nr:hypothetical protein HMN09_01252900 [Mycena chlorophos]